MKEEPSSQTRCAMINIGIHLLVQLLHGRSHVKILDSLGGHTHWMGGGGEDRVVK